MDKVGANWPAALRVLGTLAGTGAGGYGGYEWSKSNADAYGLTNTERKVPIVLGTLSGAFAGGRLARGVGHGLSTPGATLGSSLGQAAKDSWKPLATTGLIDAGVSPAIASLNRHLKLQDLAIEAKSLDMQDRVSGKQVAPPTAPTPAAPVTINPPSKQNINLIPGGPAVQWAAGLTALGLSTAGIYALSQIARANKRKADGKETPPVTNINMTGGEGGAPGAPAGPAKPSAGTLRVTLPTRNGKDNETQVEMPLEQIGLSKTLINKIRRDTKRRLRLESDGRTLHVVPPATAATKIARFTRRPLNFDHILKRADSTGLDTAPSKSSPPSAIPKLRAASPGLRSTPAVIKPGIVRPAKPGDISPEMNDQFKRFHGTDFEPTSRVDREKLTKLPPLSAKPEPISSAKPEPISSAKNTQFKDYHGTDFEPTSRVDRQKLKSLPPIKEPQSPKAPAPAAPVVSLKDPSKKENATFDPKNKDPLAAPAPAAPAAPVVPYDDPYREWNEAARKRNIDLLAVPKPQRPDPKPVPGSGTRHVNPWQKQVDEGKREQERLLPYSPEVAAWLKGTYPNGKVPMGVAEDMEQGLQQNRDIMAGRRSGFESSLPLEPTVMPDNLYPGFSGRYRPIELQPAPEWLVKSQQSRKDKRLLDSFARMPKDPDKPDLRIPGRSRLLIKETD